MTRKAKAKTGNYFSSMLCRPRRGKQEDKGVVAIVCSFPFTPDGKGARHHCPQNVSRWDLDLFPFTTFKTQANKLSKNCFNTPIKLDLVISAHHMGQNLLCLHLFPAHPPSQETEVGERETRDELDCKYKNLFSAHTQTVHRIFLSRKPQPSTDLGRNANYTQEHGNTQIQKQLQKIFLVPEFTSRYRKKNVYVAY